MTQQYGVIFDMDGVLVDSYQAHYASWRMMCHQQGLEMTEHDFAATFGRTSREVIRHFWGDRISEPRMIAALDDKKEALFRDLLRKDFPAMPGAVVLIDRLVDAGYRLAVGSSAPRENVQVVLEQLARREAFQATISGNDVTRGKPDPQVFQLAAERLGLPAAHCLVIEDAPLGVAAAHAAGMRCVGFVSTGRTAELLAGADLVIHSLGELDSKVVERLLKNGPGRKNRDIGDCGYPP
jgi:beta-phosphoglucomutase